MGAASTGHLALAFLACEPLNVRSRDVSPWELEMLPERFHRWPRDLDHWPMLIPQPKPDGLPLFFAWPSRRESAVKPERRTSSHQPL
jgi:hypothetical protein